MKVTQVSAPSPSWRTMRSTCEELLRMEPKTYIRGKFEAWWFIEFGRRILESLQRVVSEGGGSMRIHTQLQTNTFIQLLAAGIETPGRLDVFLTFHTKRSSRSTDDLSEINKGMLKRIASFFK